VDARDLVVVEAQVRRRQPADLDDVAVVVLVFRRDQRVTFVNLE